MMKNQSNLESEIIIKYNTQIEIINNVIKEFDDESNSQDSKKIILRLLTEVI